MSVFSGYTFFLIFLALTESFASEIYTNVWAVKMSGGRREVENLAKYGVSYHKHLFDDYHTIKIVKKSGKTLLSSEIDRILRSEPKVEWFMHQKEKKYKLLRYWINPELREMWYIKRPEGSNEPTLNVTAAWKSGYTGKGIVVGVVDDGVDGSHPELQDNYRWDLSYDYVVGKQVPFGTRVSGHGNNCAGVIAGKRNNNLCGVGMAYEADITGIRIFDDDIKSTDATESEALVHKLESIDIYSNSWGPGDMAWQIEGPGPLTSAALEKGIREGRNKRGAIYTFAAGNGGIVRDGCAYNGYVNSIYTIAINGVNKDGSRPSYAEECPGIMATTYSSNIGGGVVTVDNADGCVNDFGASSAATAIASGLIALTLHANPNLTWRDVQHIIANSARAAPGGVWLKQGHWLQNKAGFNVSKVYGFGLMDAGKMVMLASKWKEVPKQIKCEIEGNDKDIKIPGTVSVEVNDCAIKFLEHVQISVNLNFSRRGDLSLQLRAPSSTTSPMTRKRYIDNLTGFKNLTDWNITSLFHWEEDPTGRWELKIDDFDKRYPSSGQLHSWSLILYGTSSDPLKSELRSEIDSIRAIPPEKPKLSTRPMGTVTPTVQPSSIAKPTKGQLHSWSLILYGASSDPLKSELRSEIDSTRAIPSEKPKLSTHPMGTVTPTVQPLSTAKPTKGQLHSWSLILYRISSDPLKSELRSEIDSTRAIPPEKPKLSTRPMGTVTPTEQPSSTAKPTKGPLHSWSLILYSTSSDPLKSELRSEIDSTRAIPLEKPKPSMRPMETVTPTEQPSSTAKPTKAPWKKTVISIGLGAPAMLILFVVY